MCTCEREITAEITLRQAATEPLNVTALGGIQIYLTWLSIPHKCRYYFVLFTYTEEYVYFFAYVQIRSTCISDFVVLQRIIMSVESDSSF